MKILIKILIKMTQISIVVDLLQLVLPFHNRFGGEREYHKFISRHPEYSKYDQVSSKDIIDDNFIDNILRYVDVNSFYKSKRVYVYFVEYLLSAGIYAEHYFYANKRSPYKRFIDYFCSFISDKRDFLPLLIPNETDLFNLELTPMFYESVKIRALLIKNLIEIDQNFKSHLIFYIPNYGEIEASDNIKSDYDHTFKEFSNDKSLYFQQFPNQQKQRFYSLLKFFIDGHDKKPFPLNPELLLNRTVRKNKGKDILILLEGKINGDNKTYNFPIEEELLKELLKAAKIYNLKQHIIDADGDLIFEFENEAGAEEFKKAYSSLIIEYSDYKRKLVLSYI